MGMTQEERDIFRQKMLDEYGTGWESILNDYGRAVNPQEGPQHGALVPGAMPFDPTTFRADNPLSLLSSIEDIQLSLGEQEVEQNAIFNKLQSMDPEGEDLYGPVRPPMEMRTDGVPIGPQLNPAWQPLPPQLRQDGRPMPDDFSGEREAYLRSLQESTPDLGGGLLSDTVPPEESSFDLLSMIGQAPDAISDWWDSLSQEDQSVYKRERGAREPLVADPAEAAEYVAARKLSGPPRSSLSLSPQTSFPQMNEPPRFSGYGPRSGEGQFSQAFPGSDPNEDWQKQGWDNQPAGPLAETSSGEGGNWESDPRWKQALGRYMMQFGNNFSQTDPFYLTNDR
jgi:hypothetical protein